MDISQINILIFNFLMSSTWDCLYRCMLNLPYRNFIYNRIPEDEPSGSKHVEDIKNKKIKILIEEMCVSLVYIV